jgi:hypothetical protein
MPSARTAELLDGAVPSTAAACQTRYSYLWLGLRIDCATERVGGDPEHWVTTCADPPDVRPIGMRSFMPPPLRYEATADAGYLLHEVTDSPPDLNIGPVPAHDVSYVYDSQHRLTEKLARDVNGVEISHFVIESRDDLGNPLLITIDVPPESFNGVVYPATAHMTHTFSYDAHGRLSADQATYSDGFKFLDETVSYDDAALRRDLVIIVDSETVDSGGPGTNTTHELLDANGRLIELIHTRPGDSTPVVVDYRYDDQSRLTTRITTFEGVTATVDYIYECP